MSGIDWSKSQPSDTHYDTENRLFVNFDAMHDWNRKLVARPSPAWSGEGNPPVGIECLSCWTSGSREYHKAKIIAYDGGDVIYRWVDGPGVGLVRADDGNDFEMGEVKAFLPICTPEQIAEAEAEREAAVAAMLELDPYQPNTTLGMMSRADFCRTLHDAGYRKQADK